MREPRERQVAIPVNIRYKRVEEVIEALMTAAEGLREPYLEMIAYEQYGDTVIEVTVEGYEKMTPEQIAEQERETQALVREQEERDRALYERLKEKFEGGES